MFWFDVAIEHSFLQDWKKLHHYYISNNNDLEYDNVI